MARVSTLFPRLRRLPLGRILEWGASLLCVVFLVLWFRDRPLPDLFEGPEKTAWVLVAMGFFGGSICLAGERWHYLLRRQVSTSTRETAYRSIGLGEVANTLLPMRAGDAVRVGLVSEREGRPLSGSAGVLVVERGLGLTTQLVMLAVTGALVLSHVPQVFRDPWTTAAAMFLLIVGAGAIGWGMVALSKGVVRLAPWSSLVSLAEPFARLTAHGVVIASGLSAAVFCAEGLAWWAVAQSVGMDLPLLDALFIQTLATLAMILPAGPGSVGTLDAAIVLALGYTGRAGDESLGFILMLRLAVIGSCVGFWISVSGGDLLRRLARRRSFS